MTTDLGKIAQTLEGEYDSSKIYNKLDTVTSGGSSYVSKINNNNQPLSNNLAWQLSAKKGSDGINGVDGTNAQSFNFKGNIENYSSLPVSSNIINDAYYNEEDGLTYIYNGNSFPAQGKGVDFKGSNKTPLWEDFIQNPANFPATRPTQVIKGNSQYIVSEGSIVLVTDVPGNSNKWILMNPDIKKINGVVNSSKQLFDKENAEIELGAAIPSGLVNSNHNIRCRFYNDVLKVGSTYTINGGELIPNNFAKVLFFDINNNIIDFVQVNDSKICTFTVPAETYYTYIVLGYLNDAYLLPLRDNIVVNTVMLNESATALPYQEYGFESLKTEKLDKQLLVKIPKKNLLNVIDVDFNLMYSPGSKIIRANTGEEYIATPPIAVKQGLFYAWNGDNSGGYFENEEDTVSIDNIQFVRPVDNIGWTFQIPLNSDIKYVRLNMLRVGTSGNTLADDYQLEEGEKTSTFQPFELIEVFNPEYLPTASSNNTDSNILQKLTDVNAVTKLNHIYLPNFFNHCALKDKDITVVMVGTSLTARTVEHCTDHVDARERPPMMHSNNMASHLWDALKWDSQYYKRYDSGFFTESGSWSESSNLSNWDDGAYRNGLTKYSDSNSSNFSFQIPVKAWQFNLIFRTDSLGTENAVVNISQGNGEVQVFNEITQTWVEANGFVFSQKQDKIILPTVTIPDAQDEIDYTLTNFEIGGNTTYQKRLKMRCKGVGFDSRNNVKNVTISRTSGRLMYWGVEWSVREFMITLVNSARGSFGMRLKDQVLGLTSKQENEVWSFKPDLILTENPLHNTGAGSEPTVNYPTNYWGKITKDFFLGSNPVSFKSRATANGLNPEFLIYTSSTIGIDVDGSLKIGTDKNGKSYTSLESFSMANQFLKDNYPDVLAINSCNYWVSAGNKAFPNLKLATDGSTKSGGTFTTDGQHWNDVGGKIIAMTILPYLNFES